MFKVICIDNSPGKFNLANKLLKVGFEYNVWQCPEWPDSYKVEGILFSPLSGQKISFKKKRFIPLSNIDETELVNTKEEITYA